MMTHLTIPSLLQTLLITSAYASLFAIVILCFQPVLQRCISARWRFILWMLVLIRFLPLSLPESRFSVFNYFPHSSVAALQSSAPTVIDSQQTPSMPIQSALLEVAPQSSAPISHQIIPTVRTPFPWAASIFMLGTSILFFRLLLASFTLHKILRKSKPITNPLLLDRLRSAQNTLHLRKSIPLLQTNALSSPALVGLFRPKLLFPAHLLDSLTSEEFHQIFLHEAAHLRRRDVALNYFFSALTLLHWFNPILWLILPRIKADRELACDELVLQHTADPSTYGHTLLKIFQTNTRPTPVLALGIIDTKTFFKRRIHMIAQFKKRPAWLALPAAAALLVITACTLTTAQTPAPDEPISQRPQKGHYTLPANAVTGRYTLTNLTAAEATAQLNREMLLFKSAENHDVILNFHTDTKDKEVEIVADSAPDLDRVIARLAAADQNHSQTTYSLTSSTGKTGNRAIPRPAHSDTTAVSSGNLADMTIDEISFDKIPLTDVLTYLHDRTGLNIIANWKALEASGVDAKTPVTLHLTKVPFLKVVTLIMEQISPDTTYTFGDNVLSISAKSVGAQADLRVEIYNIRDLINPETAGPGTPFPDIQTLVEIVESTCDTDSWKTHGGTIGSIVPFKGLLTITTTPDIHEKIHKVLDNLRAADKQPAR